MLNLLPSYWQKKIEEEELFKSVVILGTVAAAAVAAFVLMLVLVKIYYSIALKDAQIAAEEKEKEIEIINVEDLEAEVTQKNKFISKIKSFYSSQTGVTNVFMMVADALPEGVTLSSMGISGKTVRLTGYSPDRNSLVILKSNLEKQLLFKNIVFPPENWLTAQGIVFDISLDYEPKP